ncbi:AN1-type zinc finger protein 1-like isoform X2 [Anneissia japonica]|uniref:AN1-type zinc finger protein 1-like isoform X2 n=1 Tax=Anneissia japonica TaxID=1529436 RepID=UPI001425743B|nr:AN1-type zinc finger protein 1-like isoform X2 [Anneissia japonica]
MGRQTRGEARWPNYTSENTVTFQIAISLIFFHFTVTIVPAHFVRNIEAKDPMSVSSHRHQQDHGCEKLVEKPDAMQKTAQLIQQIAESRESKPSKPRKKISTKAQKTAAKVALMKMKMHAVGETAVPQCERLYFQVYLPEEYRAKEKSKAMYFSKEWSVGRLVDKVASTVGLKNDNNLATSKKLRLFHPVVGVVYPMDQKLYELLDGEQCLFSGGDVIIEYVENDCTQLEDVDIYKL